MNIMKILAPERRAQIIKKKIIGRTLDKLRHVEVRNLANKTDEQFLENNKMALASFARRNNIGLVFANGRKSNKGNTIMKVFDKRIEVLADPPFFQDRFERIGSTYINTSSAEKSNSEILETIKKEVKNMRLKYIKAIQANNKDRILFF